LGSQGYVVGALNHSEAIPPELLHSFGRSDVFDLGDITAAHRPEMMMAMWVRCTQRLGSVAFKRRLMR
jgi:hypothetical protein